MLGLFGRKTDLGKALFNLTIIIGYCQKSFEDNFLMSATDQIEKAGMAINQAKKMLEGIWQVTEQGYLIKGAAEKVGCHVATLDVRDVTWGLYTLEKILNKKIAKVSQISIPHLHFENGRIEDVGGDEKGLYLIGIHRRWDDGIAEAKENESWMNP